MPAPSLASCLKFADLEGLRQALAKGADPNAPCSTNNDEQPVPPLVWAARMARHKTPSTDPPHNLLLACALLDAGARPVPPGTDVPPLSAHPLGLAAFQGHAGAVAEILAAGAPLHHLTAQGASALHLACMGNPQHPSVLHPPVVLQLLRAGLDPAALDASGRVPVEYWVERHARNPPPTPTPPPAVEAACRLAMDTVRARPGIAHGLLALVEQAMRERPGQPDPLLDAWQGCLGAFCRHHALSHALFEPRVAAHAPRM